MNLYTSCKRLLALSIVALSLTQLGYAQLANEQIKAKPPVSNTKVAPKSAQQITQIAILKGKINADDTLIDVCATDIPQFPFTITVDQEEMTVVTVGQPFKGNGCPKGSVRLIYSVIRGVNNTTPAAHKNGAAVYQIS